MSTAQAANELKQQGAIEASRDPNSSVSAEDAEKKIVEESKSAGVAAFTFNPDASPEEKRAQARAALPPGFHSKRPKGVELITDIDDGSKPIYDLPAPSTAGAIALAKDAEGKPIKDTAADDEPFGDKTGWSPRFGWPTEPVQEGESLLDHTTWLEGQLPDKFYGDWYYNAGVIVFACISSWLVAILGGGLGWIFIIMAVCATYYRTSLRRVRRNFRDDLNREMSLRRLETDTESLEWINSFLVKFWPIYQPVLAQTVINSVDQVLSSATPAFLDSLKLKTFTLGSKPPRMEHVKTYPKAEDDLVIMDWKFSFTPNDTADMTARQIKSKVNPKVVLEIRLGKAMISKGLDVIVEDMQFSGIMRVKMKLQIPFPHIEKVEICFLDRPSIDYVCKPLGGETFGFDINFIPGLESFILEQIHGNLAPMMYAPNVFPIEVAKMLAGSPVDQAIGVVAITLHGAQGLKNPDNFSGNPDPYAVVTLNKRAPLAQTKIVKDTPNPRWNETHYIIVTSFNDSLDIQVFDYNDFRKDKELGTASFTLETLEEVHEFENERLEVMSAGKARGALSCDIRFFPVLEPTKTEDSKEEPPPETNTGIVRFTVEQAKDLDGTKSLVGLLNPYAVLLLNGKEIHTTKKLKRTNNPIWDNGSKEILITDRKNAKLGVVVKDDRDIAGDQVLGTYQIKLDDMLEFMEKGQDWYNLSATKTGRVKLQAQWKPVALSGVVAGTGGYQTPIGVMRFHFQKAKDLRNYEAMGKSDPYTRVLLSGIERARTVTFKNNLNPDWDEVLYVPVHSPREKFQLEVMDSEKMGRDRSLGLVEVFAGDYISQDESGEYLVHDQKIVREDGLRLHGKGIAKGLLIYTAAFYPCLNVADPEEEEEEKEAAGDGEKKQSLDVPRSENGSADKEPSTPKMPVTPTSVHTPRKSREERTPPKVHLTPQELLKYESGLVIFKLMEAELPKSEAHIEVFVDDMAFPSYASSSAKSKANKFDEIGDCFVRELEFSKLTLKVREKGSKHDESDKDHTLARLTGNTLDTLKQCLNNPTVLKMKNEDGGTSWVKVSLKYIPVKMQLDPSESINNMGNLRVDVLDAMDLPSADANGKSDPFCKFELNGEEVFKSKVQKRTLHPAWNEFFEMIVPSRTAAKFNVKVMDWDFADKPDFLGQAAIDLAQLEPFKAQEVKLSLEDKSGKAGGAGMLRLRLLFRPDYVTRTRHGTSTFSGTFAAPGRIVTGVAGAPIKGGAAVAGVVGHGVGKGASFIKRGFGVGKKKDDESLATTSEVPTIVTTDGADPSPAIGRNRLSSRATADAEASPDASPVPAVSNGDGHARTRSIGAASVYSTNGAGPGSGTAVFTVVSASGFPPSSDVYVTITQVVPKTKTVGKTKHHKSPAGTVQFGDTFKWTCSPDAQFQIKAMEQHTFSSDEELGDALYVVDETGSNSEKELKVGSGTVVVKSTFTPTEPPNGSLGTDSPKSLRRSFLSKRESRSREGTPNP
ncbi:C2 domain-containing protein [Pleurostoma richardsiae]|uniref:C2 domain-containing protein n=1 Tax=Pleurostoma richardsiae TaxID=41990 RepID=A0AA38SDN1_9PEZI|nr:C2 domain-containing protein [Pleurostoma richardsiae]